MEAIYAPSPAAGQNKRRKKPSKKNNGPRTSVPSRTMEHVGPAIQRLLCAPLPPPSFYLSYPPNSQPQQPPLLPLPIHVPTDRLCENYLREFVSNTKPPRFYSLPNYYYNNNNINVPLPPKPAAATKKTYHSLTPKKLSKHVSNPEPNAAVSRALFLTGPHPSGIPKDVPMALSSSPPSYEVEWHSSFNDEFMAISPPPASSLPLPRFCLRPNKKLSMLNCTAAVDDGTTDKLRHILSLR